MKKFFEEFKVFITRGNVLDMAVGVIVGGAFTAIVNGLSDYILKPIINWILSLILGKGSLSEIYTFLSMATLENGAVDLENSIYIDWGSLINAIINFFLIAFVLFSIVKVINRVKDENVKFQNELRKGKLSKEDRKELKKRGIKLTDRNGVKQYLEEKAEKAKQDEEQAQKEAEEKAKAERLANPTVEDLLKDIKVLLENQAK